VAGGGLLREAAVLVQVLCGIDLFCGHGWVLMVVDGQQCGGDKRTKEHRDTRDT